MAYETAGASNVDDLLDKLRIFAIAQGWAVDFNGARTDTVGRALLINKAGVRFGFLTITTGGNADDPRDFFGVFQYPGPYNAGQLPTAQDGASAVSYSNKMPGPFGAYHFFAGANESGQSYLHIVVEAQAGSFRHIGAGVINKQGAVTTGAYTHASRWNFNANYVNDFSNRHSMPWDSTENVSASAPYSTSIRADSDALSPRYFQLNASGIASQALGGFWSGYGASGMAPGVSSLTGRAILLPIFAYGRRPGGFYSILGGPPDLRFVDMANLLPGDLVALGPDTWKVFPIIRKSGAPGQENSRTWGYAYRVVP